MNRLNRAISRSVLRRSSMLLITAALLVGCDASPGPTISPTALTSAPSSPSATTQSPEATPGATQTSIPTASPTPTSSPVPTTAGPLTVGALAVTVSDHLRVRSQPRVATDSAKYEPTLPLGTQLVVEAGPVKANDYTWWRVAPVGVSLAGALADGWVAIADHDGTPWVELSDDPSPGFDLVAGTISPPATPDVATARRQAEAVNAFGIALYKRLLADPALALAAKGTVVSPYSIVTALAMARAGALGDTASQMDLVLRTNGWTRLGPGLSALDGVLRQADGTWTDPDEPTTHQLALRTANMAFGQRDLAIKPEFLDRLGQAFGSGYGLVDYIRDPDAAREAINGWVSHQTVGRIPNLLSPADISPATRIVLVNAIYLKAEWARPFEPENTRDRAFRTLAGSTVKVPTMYQRGGQQIPLATGPGWKATELYYEGPDASQPLVMTLILPDKLGAFERSLTPNRLQDVIGALRTETRRLEHVTHHPVVPPQEFDCGTYPYETNLYLPKFGIDTRAELSRTLGAMGMADAFSSSDADFTGITDADRLHIGFVIHQANIDVDESGTEAAAATAVGGDTTGGCGGPEAARQRTLRFDRPFLFLLRDAKTGAILFMGRVTDPTRRN